jgi:hypothetical protein
MPGQDVRSNYDAVLRELNNGGGTSHKILTAPYNGCPLLGAYMLSAVPYINTSDFVTLTSSPGELASVDEIGRIVPDQSI